MKELIKYLIIGIVQGLGEVLPISSSAHLIIFEEMLGINDDNLTLEVFLHLASLVAIIFFLRKKLIKLISGFFKYLFKREEEDFIEFKIGCFLIISTIPIVIVTILFKKWINTISSNILFVSLFLVVNGIFLLIINNIKGNKNIEKMNILDALTIGLFQCLGIFPGISRSGSCIYGANFRKLEKNSSAEYAFLLFVPAVVGATILEFKNFGNLIVENNLWMYLITFIVTCIITYFAFEILLKTIKKGKIKYFGYYCILIGIINGLLNIIK
jgi:undecaprenyl-diphosphatase